MSNHPLHCACLIHGDKYKFEYVDKLYRALTRNFSDQVILHVFCEVDREVPAPYVKHALKDWNLNGANRAWWYKLQLFEPGHFDHQVIYFDLDMVITGNLDWMRQLSADYFWSIQDFRHLWRPSSTMMNSSVMAWDAPKFWWVHDQLVIERATSLFRGDQEYLSNIIQPPLLKFIEQQRAMSWRWQAMAGGYDFAHRCHRQPGAAAFVPETVSLLVFHGDPKPHEETDPVVKANWY